MFKKIIPAAFAASLISAVTSAVAADFEVHSDDLKTGVFNDTQVATGFGCHGGNVSPHIAWSGAPAGTKSFLITMYDPDAPTGSGFWHWVLADVPATTQTLPRGIGGDTSKLPAGTVQISNDTGKPGYLGPCPPTGETHRYLITVTALKVDKLGVDPAATPAVTGFMAHFQTLGKASMIATFGR